MDVVARIDKRVTFGQTGTADEYEAIDAVRIPVRVRYGQLPAYRVAHQVHISKLVPFQKIMQYLREVLYRIVFHGYVKQRQAWYNYPEVGFKGLHQWLPLLHITKQPVQQQHHRPGAHIQIRLMKGRLIFSGHHRSVKRDGGGTPSAWPLPSQTQG